ncbi:MAG: FIST C-terminal domain-containing protein [Bacteroidota bacterium]
MDHRPAFEVYKEVVEKHGGQQFSDDNFFDIAKAYPFGISKVDAERVVRDPLMVQENSLVCVGEVPQGAYVDILNGNQDTLIGAARKAKEFSESNMEDPTKMRFFIDCISRVLFLEENFSEELKAVSSPDIQTIGACTLGEIANNQDAYLEFYNKTAVVINLG